ncbi:hypothetical protein D3C86_1810210 [compost metagenome]
MGLSRREASLFSRPSFILASCLTVRLVLESFSSASASMASTTSLIRSRLKRASKAGSGLMKPNEEWAMITASQLPVAILARNLRRLAFSKSFFVAVRMLAPGYSR